MSKTASRAKPKASSAPRQIVVLGMHRSGTSAVTGALAAMGVHVGDDDQLTGKSWENPKGFFERKEARRICDALLHASSADWWKVSGFDPDNADRAEVERQRKAISALVADLDAHGHWALKEPRLCVLFPIFKAALDRAVPVITVRHPVEIAHSLRRRNGFPLRAGTALWEAYMTAALRHARELDPVFVSYSALVEAPRASLAALADALEARGVTGLNAEAAIEAISADLRREQAEPEAERWLTPSAKALWETLQAPEGLAQAPALSSDAIAVLREFEADEAGRRKAEAEIVALKEERTSLKQKITDLWAAVHTRDAKLAEERETLKALREERKPLSERLSRQAEVVKALNRRLDSAQDRIASISGAEARARQALETERARRETAEHKLTTLAPLQKRVRELEAQLEQARQRSQVLEEGLAAARDAAERAQAAARALRQTWSWRVTRPLRALRRNPVAELRTWVRTRRSRRRLAGSPLFDAAWYRAQNPDVASGGGDPLTHFLRSGWREGRRPNPVFDPAWYLERYPDVAATGQNPLAHYVLSGAAEGRDPAAEFSASGYLDANPDVAAAGLDPLSHYLSSGRAEGRKAVPAAPAAAEPSAAPARWAARFCSPAQAAAPRPVRAAAIARRLKDAPAPVVVVPVYNAAKETDACLASVRAHTPKDVRVIVLDDASPEADVAGVLARHGEDARIEVRRNPSNLGFAANVNQGFALAPEADIVLLNADTEVGPNWLRNLRMAAYSSERVGTATPFSDNAGAFSAPAPNAMNPLPAGLTVGDAARAVAQAAVRFYPETPTGNGFCLYVRRTCLDEVGVFDAEAFPRGYGEENDFCMRARRLGWMHVIDDAGYVRHVRSASFGEEKTALLKANRAVLDQRHPDYTEAVREAMAAPAMRAARARVGEILKAAARGRVKPRVLALAGAAPSDAEAVDVLRLSLVAESIRLCGEDVQESAALGAGLFETAADWLQRFGIERVLIAPEGGAPESVLEAARALGVPVTTATAPSPPPEEKPRPQGLRRRLLGDPLAERAARLAGSPLFDAEHYAGLGAGIPSRPADAARHYLEAGAREGRSPHPLFDPEWYAGQTGAPPGPTPLEHYLQTGWRDGLSPHPLFDPAWYLERNPDLAALERSPLEHYLAEGAREGRSPHPAFDAEGYLPRYRDVAAAGAEPLTHYLRSGADEGRDPSLDFSTRGYLAANRDVAEAGVNPLVHWVTQGAREGRAGARHEPAADRRLVLEVAGRALEGKPKRFMERFDHAFAGRYGAALDRLAAGLDLDDQRVSIVMPTFNRAGKIPAAIRSVLDQSHRNFELLVVDDGSDDETLAILEGFSEDPRIQVFRNNHRGVSAARNTGLEAATGEAVFYLDSDNTWTPHHVRRLLVLMALTGARCAYSATSVIDARGRVTGYRGEPYDWESCLAANYVDMNVFAHRRELADERGVFDTGLKRMVDWDLILRYTKNERTLFAPFIGCRYLDDKGDAARVTHSQPYAFRRVVHLKNAQGHATAGDAIDAISWRILIRIPAPFEKRMAWGDFHYAESLKTALERAGHSVRIAFLGDWYEHDPQHDDVVLCLRGLTAHEPRAGQLNILWNISHPDQVGIEELESHHLVFVASLSYAALLEQTGLSTPVTALLQASDTDRFFWSDQGRGEGRTVFVGNSRNEHREMVRWAGEAGVDLAVYGGGWSRFLPADEIVAENVPNTELGELYGAAKAVLNDHWASMRDFGFVSNRLFDIVAAGGRPVSDRVASAERVFGDLIASVDSADALGEAVSAVSGADDAALRRDGAAFLAEHHSFDARAHAILAGIKAVLTGGDPREAAPAPAVFGAARPRRRIGLLLQGHAWPTSSGFIRLICPLTSDEASTRAEIVRLSGVEDPAIDGLDAVVVQRIAVASEADAERLIDRARQAGAALYVDNDDAFRFHGDLEAFDAPLRRLMRAADAVWFSTERLKAFYAEAAPQGRVIANTLDPRLWRDYRNPPEFAASGSKTRFLYMGTATHDADFELVRPAFEKLHARHPGRFELTIVGAVRQTDPAPWLVRRPPPHRSYPVFARWLRDQRAFDVGIAPLQPSEFNAAKSDIKHLDYSAIGLASILSAGPAYDAAIEAGLALGAASDAQAWFDLLERAVLDAAALTPMRRAAHDAVWERRDVSATGRVLLDAMGG